MGFSEGKPGVLGTEQGGPKRPICDFHAGYTFLKVPFTKRGKWGGGSLRGDKCRSSADMRGKNELKISRLKRNKNKFGERAMHTGKGAFPTLKRGLWAS